MNTLYKLNINEIARISYLADSISVVRLSEMGVVSGAKVRMIKKNPLGGPIQIKINDSYLILRKEDAIQIYIKNNNEK